MLDNYLDFKNGYKVLYEAKDKVTEEAPGPFYASKILQRVEDEMCVSYNKDTDEYVDLKQFKLIYSDGKNLIGSLKNYPTEDDIKIVIKDTEGKIVLGEGSEEPPVPKYNLTITCDSDNVEITGTGSYEEGTEVTVTLAPAAGYEFNMGDTSPKLDGVDMDREMGAFSGKVVMGAEDKTAAITGVIVKALPVARDLFFTEVPLADTPIGEAWSYEAVAGRTRVNITTPFPDGVDEAYPAIAINPNVATIQDILNSLDASELANFNVTDEEYAGVTYKRYTFKEGVADEQPFTLLLNLE